MDFGALPPEINSARMYAGAGAAPMMAAAAGWNRLAVELSTTAVSFESVITQLTTEQWMGPASMSMAAAAQPYLAWLTYTAESAARAGSQATASAAAFEAAFAATVPPAEVAANRAQLAMLVATNVLGQNTPAIAATEAQYGEMWAQDALAMYGYAASSAAAGTLNPLTTPSQIANPAGLASQAAAVSQAAASNTIGQVGLSNLITNLPNAIMGLSSPAAAVAASTGLDSVIQDITSVLGIPFVQNAINGAVNTAAWFVMAAVPNAVFLGHTLSAVEAVGAPAAADLAPALAPAASLRHAVTPAGYGGTPVSAGLGDASSVGKLSVPVEWSNAVPATTSGATALDGSGWAVPEEAGPIAAMPGAPGMAVAGKGAGGFAGPRYGFKPIVMPKQVVV
ncbi:putative PPE family protein PPE29 [Mycobacterium basiliense]|uniref:Putative PPE family protein PPE29 n=1 Tax=Mycobacterium basiliense TaxID=2094119 RepID=A0A447GCJ7_9MYCO|nr:PPE family protein [Mycobacterium basiliense]VDM88211.1 putative PPE family protein PPE29 [Mycobacterium basiliense]